MQMRQMNLYYPQVKNNTGLLGSVTTAIPNGADTGKAPLITFDHHYSSDEDMMTSSGGAGLKKHRIQATNSNAGCKRKIGWAEENSATGTEER
jgi:hypothetical protein